MKDFKKLLQVAQDFRRELKEGGVSVETGNAFEAVLAEFDPVDPKDYKIPDWDKFTKDKDVRYVESDGICYFSDPDGDRYCIGPKLYNALRHVTRKKS